MRSSDCLGFIGTLSSQASGQRLATLMAKRTLRLMMMAVLTATISAPAMAYNTLSPNCGGAHWKDSELPVAWYLDQAGYSQMSNTQLEGIFQTSFQVWGAPCCSKFSANYMGPSSVGPTNSSNTHVLGFIESNWPSTLGDVNSTIGVTPVQIWQDCTMAEADIVFNAVTFRFVNGMPQQQNDADLMSIAVHEMGHFLGLDHSMISGVTMYPSYSNGIVERDLHQDDINGVCALYTKSCTCTSPADCASGETCQGGACVVAPCSSNASCQAPLVCNNSTGKCEVPPCTSASDCSAGYACQGGTCVRNASCIICEPCTTNADCGAAGMCVSFGSGGVCTQSCGQSGCPGNSSCFQVPDSQGQTFNICLNVDAGANPPGACPSSYVCADPCAGVSCPAGQSCDAQSGSCITPSCNGLGNDCANNGAACTPDNDVCIGSASSSYCSCRCTDSAICGSTGSCLDSNTGAACAGGGSCACYTQAAPDPCAGVSCPAASVCDSAKACCIDSVGLCWVDSDSDGVSDATDNCPQNFNPTQSDVDADGVGDVCDTSSPDGGVDAGSSDGGASTDGGGIADAGTGRDGGAGTWGGSGEGTAGCFCGSSGGSPSQFALFLLLGLGLKGLTRGRTLRR